MVEAMHGIYGGAEGGGKGEGEASTDKLEEAFISTMVDSSRQRRRYCPHVENSHARNYKEIRRRHRTSQTREVRN